MKTRKEFEVFDFVDEDENPGLTKFKHSNALDKYAFLQHASQEPNIHPIGTGNVLSIDIDIIKSEHKEKNVASGVPLDAGEHSLSNRMAKLDVVTVIDTEVSQKLPQCSPAEAEPEIISSETERNSSPAMDLPDDRKLNSDFLESLSNDDPDESTDMVPNADEITSERSPSVCSADAEDEGHIEGQSPDNCFGGWIMEDANMEVVFCPDYIVYRDIYCTNAMLSFLSSCIVIKGSTACEGKENFVFEWGIGDIIDIQYQFCQTIETAMIKMRVISKDAEHSEDAYGTSGIEELKFAIVDPEWHMKLEEIMSLDIYRPLWKVTLEERNGYTSTRENGASCSKPYFPVFDEPFDEVVYPKGDSDAVSISKRDVDLLQPDTFVNDTIIDFYMKYLKNKISLNERQRFHFFNSFFFRKLADLDKDPNSVFDARAAFQRVRKWTRKLNLFEKEYIFIPVNFNLHWSLLVICHPGEVATIKDEDAEKSERVPCILHMDSIRGSHSGLKSLLQSYLWEEWKERHKEASEDVSSRFLNLRFVSLELPQQQNSFDCGLFLLHYAELFLEKSPLNFNPFKLTKFSKFLAADWFQPSEASLKRALIHKLIYNLLNNSSPDNSPPRVDHRNHEQIPDIPKPNSNNNNEMPIEFLSERCVGSKSPSDLIMRCEIDDDDGIELSLLPTSSPSLKNPHCDSGLASRGFFNSETSVGSLLAFNQPSACNDFKPASSPIEEIEVEAEEGEHSNKGSRMPQEPSIFSHASQDIQADPSTWIPTGENDSISSPQPSKCGSHEENSQPDRDLTLDKHQMLDNDYNENEDSPKSMTENLSGFCFQENVTPSPTGKDVSTVLEEPDVCRPIKKMKIATEVEG